MEGRHSQSKDPTPETSENPPHTTTKLLQTKIFNLEHKIKSNNNRALAAEAINPTNTEAECMEKRLNKRKRQKLKSLLRDKKKKNRHPHRRTQTSTRPMSDNSSPPHTVVTLTGVEMSQEEHGLLPKALSLHHNHQESTSLT